MAQFFVKCSDKFLFKNYSANHKLLKAKPCLSQLCGGSGVYQFNWERKVFQQMVLEHRLSAWKKINLNPYFTLYSKTILKWNTVISIKAKNVKLKS